MDKLLELYDAFMSDIERLGQENKEAVKAIWSDSKELAAYADPDGPLNRDTVAAADWQAYLYANRPDVRFWALALFNVCGRHGYRKHFEEAEEIQLKSLPGFGMF